MSWFSILPESLSFLETWAIRMFLLLGTLAIGPWILLLIYDVILFLFRAILYDLPIIGGRARNRPRPRAPSLSKRPGGRPRSLSFSLPGVTSAPTTTGIEEKERNGSAVQRSGKTDLSREVTGRLQAFYDEHEWEALVQVDKSAIASETGLTTSQVKEWFTLAHQRQTEEAARTEPA